jgi:NAD(P)-dependent dehydrogenase (short-subunit alcohol dehydrogenase family)
LLKTRALGISAVTIAAGLAVPATPAAVLSQAEAAFGAIEILVNNPGIGRQRVDARLVVEFDDDPWLYTPL